MSSVQVIGVFRHDHHSHRPQLVGEGGELPSLVWRMTLQEAHGSPYEYEVREQFFREAASLLDHLYRLLHTQLFRFTIDDRTVEKAQWMLLSEALCLLRESMRALKSKKHRLAVVFFRIALENMDRAAYFWSTRESAPLDLERWYDGKVIPHKKWREHLEALGREELAASRRRVYKQMSSHIHGTYPALLTSYIAGGQQLNFMVHDGFQALDGNGDTEAETFLVHPQVIAEHCATSADLIVLLAEEIAIRGVASEEEVVDALRSALEVETVPRRFALPRRFAESSKQ